MMHGLSRFGAQGTADSASRADRTVVSRRGALRFACLSLLLVTMLAGGGAWSVARAQGPPSSAAPGRAVSDQAGLAVGDQAGLAAPLAPLGILVGKTWRGELAGSTPEKPLVDVVRWERALNGQAVRALHSVNAGEYGGETIYIWDPESKTVIYFYFTTAGFFTRGTVNCETSRMLTHETVTGNPGGITEVRSTVDFLPDGRMTVTAEYFRDGRWSLGHEVVYVEDPSAQVVFR